MALTLIKQSYIPSRTCFLPVALTAPTMLLYHGAYLPHILLFHPIEDISRRFVTSFVVLPFSSRPDPGKIFHTPPQTKRRFIASCERTPSVTTWSRRAHTTSVFK